MPVTHAVRIVPAILTDSLPDLQTMLRVSACFTDYVQVDFMDGEFVPSRSVDVAGITSLDITCGWEAHLMVRQPESHFETCRQAGAAKVIFHFEATQHPHDVVAKARTMGLGVGLAVNPETPIEAFAGLAGAVDSVLFLSVHPGYYGATFLPEVLEKIKRFNALGTGVLTGIDGGVKEANITEIAATGVDDICVGSAVFLQDDPAASFRRLQTLANFG
ncbi:ribulose-phosphate 3-epimerase [Chloroflexota bacterium]